MADEISNFMVFEEPWWSLLEKKIDWNENSLTKFNSTQESVHVEIPKNKSRYIMYVSLSKSTHTENNKLHEIDYTNAGKSYIQTGRKHLIPKAWVGWKNIQTILI